MIEALVSEADLRRRVAAREFLRGSRQRVRCRHCRKSIPPERRADARYCSRDCKDEHHGRKRAALRQEVDRANRAVRARAPCRRCGGPMPAGKRVDAKFCSRGCKAEHHWRQQYRLRQEVRRAVRNAPAFCPAVLRGEVCGAPINASPLGPVALTCPRCYQREYGRRRRARGKVA